MNDAIDSLSPAWRKTLEAIERRQSSPVMLPLAIGAIVEIFESGTNDGAVLRFEDYEQRFRALAARHSIRLKSGPWMPYLALAGSLGVLQCIDRETERAVEFGSRRPRSRAALLKISRYAMVENGLREQLGSCAARDAMAHWVLVRIGAQREA